MLLTRFLSLLLLYVLLKINGKSTADLTTDEAVKLIGTTAKLSFWEEGAASNAASVPPAGGTSHTPTPTPTPTITPAPTFTPSPTPISITSHQLDSWFEKYSREYSIDKSKLWNVAVCESKLRPNAKNGDYLGLYQFSTRTWQSTRRAMNMDDHPELRRNPEESIRTAAFKIATEGLKSWPNCGK